MHDARVGLLVIQRGIEPARGGWALPGGFLEEHEDWQTGVVRELHEETGIVLSSSAITPFWFASSTPRPNRVLLFATAPVLREGELPPFEPTEETAARGVYFGGDLPKGNSLAFSLHEEAAQRFFATRPGSERDKNHAPAIVPI
jgi:ADP-ribose pyrophosphatase YjhB (NUDIX family)